MAGGDPTNVLGRRVAAFIVDWGVQVLSFVLAMQVLVVTIVPGPAPGTFAFEGPAVDVAIATFLPLAYFVGFYVIAQGRLGWTPGKLLCGVRLVKRNGKPAGMFRAFVHSLLVSIAWNFGIFGSGIFLVLAYVTKGHRHPGDYLGGTFVVDSWAAGREIIMTGQGAQSGGITVTRSDAKKLVGADDADLLMARTSPNEPVFDKNRDTYIVWRTKEERLFVFEKSTGQWQPLD